MDNTQTELNGIGIQTEGAATPALSIMEHAVLLQVSISRFGLKRKLSTSQIAVDAEKTYIHASKELLKSKRYEAIVKRDSEFRAALMAYCLPSMFKEGIYLLPHVSVKKVEGVLADYKNIDRPALVEAFIEEYPERRAEAEAKLGSCFDATQYPSPETVRACFGVQKRYLTFSTPDKLKEIDPELAQEESDALIASFANAREEGLAALRAGFAEIVGHMVDKLTADPTGKRKVFRDSLVGNVRGFIDQFSAKNSVFGDEQLATLVGKARDILDGVSPEMLRDERINAREIVRNEMGEVKAALSKMMEDAPTRKIDFGSED